MPKVEANLFHHVYLEGVGRWRVENPQIQGQRERGFRTGVKEEEEKHKLWGQKGLFSPLIKPRLKGSLPGEGSRVCVRINLRIQFLKRGSGRGSKDMLINNFFFSLWNCASPVLLKSFAESVFSFSYCMCPVTWEPLPTG